MADPCTTLVALAGKLDKLALIRRLCDMIAIPSENPFDQAPSLGYREQEMGDYLLQRLKELSFEVDSHELSPGRRNVWGRLKGKGNGPSLMLVGHLDTVGTEGYPEAFRPRVDGDCVYGRGACDMKGALACYLETARLIVESDIELNGDLLIVGVVDEEWQLTGSQHLGLHGPWADYAIVGEGTSSGANKELSICAAHKGDYAVKIRTFGTAVHSSVPEQGHNAISDMAEVVRSIDRYHRELGQREPHPLCGHGTASVGVISGGSMACTVPDCCEIHVDRRMLPGETVEQINSEYEQLLGRIPRLRFEIGDPLTITAALDVPVDCEVVEASVEAYKAVTGNLPTIRAHPAATDAPNLGFPAVIFGPGAVEQAHTVDEFVRIDELEIATKVYLGVVLRLLSAEEADV